MLDNLKLGYGGTKQEMERLLEDAEKLTGKKFDISNFSDITEAIHAVQTEMGITGTTAKEASGTIQGSLGAVKSSWQNLLTGFADGNRDMGELMDNFVNSVGDAAKNIIPRVKQAVKSITQNLGDLAGKLVSGFFGEKTGAAVKKTVDVIMRAVERLLKILEGFGPVIEIAMNFVSELVSNILPPLMSILETIMPIVEKIAHFVANVLIGAVKVLGGALKALEGILKPILDLLSPLFDLLGMVGEGLGAIGDGIGYLLSGCPQVAANFEEVMDAAEGLSTQIDNTLTSWDNFVDSQDKALQASMDEVDQIGKLKEELDGLVDENGKVKKGYEDRASYVANELSELTGQEIKVVDGQIKKYDELSKKIEETLQKKKIAALEEYYSGIITEYGKTQAQDKYELMRIATQISDINDAMSKTSENTDEYNQLVAERNELVDKSAQLTGKLQVYGQAQIEQEKLWKAVSEKNYKAIDQLSKNHVEVIKTETGEFLNSTEDKILAETNWLEAQKANLEEAKRRGDTYNQEVFQKEVQASEDRIKVLKDEYVKKKPVVKEGVGGWLDVLRDFTVKSKLESATAGRESGDKYASGIRSKKGEAASASGEVRNSAIGGFGGGLWDVAFAANNMVDTFISTIRSKRQQSYNAGWFVSKGATKGMMDAAQIKSPSRVTRWIGEMMGKGLEIGWTKSGRSAIDMINKDMRFSGSMDFSSSISHNSIVGELLKYVKSIDKKSGKSGNVYFNGSRGDNIDDFSKVLSRQVIMARRV
jgi:ABC-type transporter Mla subunit MlaD